MTKTKSIYETPLVRVEAVSTECGFAGSGLEGDCTTSDYNEINGYQLN